MLKIDHIMLDQNIIFDIVDMQFEAPGHGDFHLDRKINKMSNHFISVWYLWSSFNRDVV